MESESHLIINDEVYSPMSGVVWKIREMERLIYYTLTGKGSVSVKEYTHWVLALHWDSKSQDTLGYSPRCHVCKTAELLSYLVLLDRQLMKERRGKNDGHDNGLTNQPSKWDGLATIDILIGLLVMLFSLSMKLPRWYLTSPEPWQEEDNHSHSLSLSPHPPVPAED